MEQARPLPQNEAEEQSYYTLYLTNLSPHLTKTHLCTMLLKFGTIIECFYPRSEDGMDFGMARIVYAGKEQVDRAARALHGEIIYGRRICASTNFERYIRRDTKPAEEPTASGGMTSPDTK